MDLSKLQDAPWAVVPVAYKHCPSLPHAWAVGGAECDSKELAEFAALARNAEDVQMRRGWSVERCPFIVDGVQGEWWWIPEISEAAGQAVDLRRDHPFTAFVEAEKWYVQHCAPGKDREP